MNGSSLFAPAALLLTTMLSASSVAGSASDVAAMRQRPPGEGVLCMWGLLNIAAEVGRRCRPGANPTLQTELDRSVSRIEVYILRNSDIGSAGIEAFKREQGMTGASDEALCRPDPIRLYDHFAAAGSGELGSGVDEMLAQPGEPTWGDCL